MLKYNDTTQNYELFDIVINATGSKTHLSQLDEDDQLILNLENRQIVQRHPWVAFKLSQKQIKS